MRILIFSTDDHLYPAGGAEQAFGNITERLPNIEFDLICARIRKSASKYEKIKNVNIYRVGFGIPRVDGLILAVFGHHIAMKLIKKNSYNLIWSVMASYGAFAAIRVKKKAKLPLLLTLQEGDSFEYIYNKVKLVRKSFNNIFRQADAIQAISNYLLNWSKEMGYKGNLGNVIPNGVAVGAFTKDFSNLEIKEKRKTFGFRENVFVLITTSRLEIKNGIGDVISALEHLPENVCFIVCGSGILETSLRKQVEKLGLEERVLFKGFVDPSELPILMKASDAFIRPSLTEGLGNAFLEAMASRIITIGTNAGGIPDFLKDGETGYVVKIKNPKSIANTVQKVINLDTEQKEQILDRAKEMVILKYDWDLVSKDMKNMFNEVIACK